MPPKKWDDKKERDLLMAMRFAESGYNAVTKQTWEKAADLMRMMGYEDVTWTGISQRWLKSTQKQHMRDFPNTLTVAQSNADVGSSAGGVVVDPAPAESSAADDAPCAARVPRVRVSKRKRQNTNDDEVLGEELNVEDELNVGEEADSKDDNDIAVEQVSARKRQRKGKKAV